MKVIEVYTSSSVVALSPSTERFESNEIAVSLNQVVFADGRQATVATHTFLLSPADARVLAKRLLVVVDEFEGVVTPFEQAVDVVLGGAK